MATGIYIPPTGASTAYADNAARQRQLGLAVQKTATVAMTMQRNMAGNAAVSAGASGTLALWAIEVPPLTTFGFIAFHSGATAGVALLNQWFCLCDSNRVLLAITGDDTTVGWGATSEKKLAIAQTTAGSATTYTTLNTVPALFYVGAMIKVTTTVPSLAGISTLASVNTYVPIAGGTSTASLSTPSTATGGATTYAAITPAAGTPIVELTTA